MSQWFHAEGSRQAGPVSAEDIAALFRSNRIGLDTLVWRDGLPAWQPVRSVVEELGLTPIPAATAGPAPSLPPGVPPPVAPAARVPLTMQPQKKGLSGCAITAIIGGAALLILVPVCAILTAIALPAYNDYTLRAKVAQSLGALQPLKTQVQEFASSEGRCPTSNDPDFPAHDAFVAQGLSSVQLGQFENNHCGIEATLSIGKPTLDGDLLWLEFDPASASWECSGDSEDNYLPVDCRG